MTSRIAAVALAAAGFMAFEASAQTAPEAVVVAPAAPTVVAAPAPGPVVASGTPIRIEVAETVSTKTHKQGDFFAIRLAVPILYDGKVIVPAGVPGQGQVVDSGPPEIGGGQAKLVLAARWVEYDGKRIPVRTFRFAMGGKDRSGAAMAISMASPLGGILVRGGHVVVEPGAVGDAKLAADLPAVPAVIAVTPPAPTAQPAAQPAPATPAQVTPAQAAPAPSAQ